MATAKVLVAATIGLVFGMLSVYALLNPGLRVLETELAQTSEQLILQESQIADLTSEIEELAVEKENLESEMDSRRKTLVELQGFLDGASIRLRDGDEEKQTLELRIANLNTQISEKESEIGNLDLQVSTLQDEINRLEDLIESLELRPPPPPGPSQNLRLSVENFHSAVEALDVAQVLTFYAEGNTRADWTGQAGVYAGTYPGFSNVRLLWASWIGNLDNIQIGMRNYQESIVGDEALVTYTITNIGHGRVNLRGEFEMIIEVTTIWNLVDETWLIEEDTWDFVFYRSLH